MSRRITVVRHVGLSGGVRAAQPRTASAPRRPAGPARGQRLLRAGSAVAAQFTQALTSLMFGVLGLRVLSASDFGVLSLLLGAVVVATAVMTGFVGDSLTVLDRRQPSVRAALLWCAAGLASLLLVAAATTTWGLGLLPGASALLFGAAVAAFVLEDTGRRLLMACLRFWAVVVVDLAYAVAAVAVLLSAARGPGRLSLEDFLLALLVGQLVALAVAVVLLPAAERRLPARVRPDLRLVAAFGGWRALQQTVRPGLLTLVRSLVLAASGAVALATFEAGRLYISPALLLMQGAGSFLLARNAVERTASTREALRRADLASAALAGAGLVAGGALIAALPWLGPLLTGGSVAVSAGNIAAWTCLAAASGLSMPYGTLATVRVRPQLVLFARLADTAVALTAVGLVILLVGAASPLLPLGLAAGWTTSALLQRHLVARGGLAPATGGAAGGRTTADRVVRTAAGSRGTD